MSFTLILIASLMGSPHCGAMCGGFTALVAERAESRVASALYHLGRLVTYLVLGAASGVGGKLVEDIGVRTGISRAAALCTGIVLILGGVSTFSTRMQRIWSFVPLSWIFGLRERLLPSRSRPYLFPFSLGLLSTLLPCGWLYSYLAVAAGTGNILSAVAVMAVFWIGTLPILLAFGGLTAIISSPLKRAAPMVISALMICAGFFSLASHLGYSPNFFGRSSPHCAMHGK